MKCGLCKRRVDARKHEKYQRLRDGPDGLPEVCCFSCLSTGLPVVAKCDVMQPLDDAKKLLWRKSVPLKGSKRAAESSLRREMKTKPFVPLRNLHVMKKDPDLESRVSAAAEMIKGELVHAWGLVLRDMATRGMSEDLRRHVFALVVL